jgi:mRNA interferase HigB
MRVIATNTLKKYGEKYPEATDQLMAWYEEAEDGIWNNPNEVKRQFGNASILTDKRVVFNIHDNKYRLIVDIEYRYKIIFILWFGTHKNMIKLTLKQ